MDYFKGLSILSGELFKANFFFISDSLNFLLSFCVLFLFFSLFVVPLSSWFPWFSFSFGSYCVSQPHA